MQEYSHPKPPNHIPYLVTIVVMATLGVGGILGVLVLRPHEDNTAILVAIAGFIGPTTAALLAFIKTQETHVAVNGRMDEFKALLARNVEEAERRLAAERGEKLGLEKALQTIADKTPPSK